MVGFAIQNQGAFKDNYICPACCLMYRNPIQLACSHRCCESCIDDQTRETIKCTECHEETLRSEMFCDRGMKNDMKMLKICCYLCRWAGLFKNYQDHLTVNHFDVLTGSYIENGAFVQIRRLQKVLNEYTKNVRALRATVKQISTNILPDKTSIEEQDHGSFVSYDRTLLMKIDNVPGRLNGDHSVITSPPFYTSSDGYKMCVRLYLNGNGAGQSTHMSIYLILMRGDYDAVLEWPFNYQVIFCLFDLTDQKNHIIESFQRPQGDTNMEFGISQFISLSKLQQNPSPYFDEGSMYIKVMVRKNPLPAFILAKVMNMNPGLPLHAQEEMIENEIQRNRMPTSKVHQSL